MTARPLRTTLRLLWLLAAALVGLAVLGFAALMFVDSERGHALLLRQLPGLRQQSGLTIAADRIDGSLFGRATLHGLRLGDPQGVFASAPLAEVDWRPLDLLDNRLTVRLLTAPELRLLRLPKLRPSGSKRLLPKIDIVIGTLRIDRLVLEPPVIGRAQTLSLAGSADIRSGRAKLDLTAMAIAGASSAGDSIKVGATDGDSIRVHLDAEPDRDRFDVAATVAAPKGGVITTLLGLAAPFGMSVSGDGRWSDWRGSATATLGIRQLAKLALGERGGAFALTGTAAPSLLLDGIGARLSGPNVALDATARLTGRRLDATLHAASPAVRLTVRGGLDFASETFAELTAEAVVLRPTALDPRLSGKDIKLAARIGGSFAAPLVDYTLTSPAFRYGTTGFSQFRATGVVAAAQRPLTIPVTATATRLSGVGETGAALLTNLHIVGPLVIARGQLSVTGLTLRSDRLSGTGRVTFDFASGRYVADVDALLPRYAVAGLGIADVTAKLHAVPGNGGTRATGSAVVAVTRLDNAFFAKLLQGLPRITTSFDAASDLSVGFSGTRLTAPGLTLAGAGSQSPAGIVRFTGQGVSRAYGPVTLALAGLIDTPTVDLQLAHPGLGLGLTGLVAHIAPAGSAWSFDAHGGSSYGTIAARGSIDGSSGPLAIDIAQATLAGLTTHGHIVQIAAGPFAGRLDLTGDGLHGSVALAGTSGGAVQRADVALTAAKARLALTPAVTIGRGTLSATVLLPDSGASVQGRFDLGDVHRGGLVLSTTKGSIAYANDRGTLQLNASGTAGVSFTLATTIVADPARVTVAVSATAGDRALTLDHPAVLTRVGAAAGSGTVSAWSLAPVAIVTPDGRTELSGRYGDGFAVHARLDRIGLELLTIVSPDLAITGKLSGTLDLSAPADGALPTGNAALRVTGLTRTGLAAASLPVDIALNAAISNGSAAARATIIRGGVIEGRIQAQLKDIPGARAEPLLQRLLAAPLFAQARYNGPAQALWPLAGVEAVDVRGTVQIAADIGGHLGDPRLTGTIRTAAARFETATLGTVVDNIALDSRFTESRLDLTSFTGTVGKDGKVSGSGSIDLSLERNFPLNLRLNLINAQVLNRDDLRATLTGPLTIVSNAAGAKISGKLTVDRGRLRIGKPAVEDVPVLDVREVNAALLGRRVKRENAPTKWSLDVTLSAPGRLEVTGMGIESEWRGDLRVTGAATAPQLTGRVQVVRGDYEFAGKRFELTRGDLRFAGGYPPDPVVDVIAENTSSGFTAQLAITGTAQRPEIKFSSVPALPEDEVLSRVLFGASITSLSAPEAIQLAGALASLRSNGKGTAFNPINLVRKTLHIDRLRILPANATLNRKTSVAAGQYIGRRVYVELATDAQGYTASTIEVSLTRALSVLSEVATQGGTSVNLRWKRDY